MVSRNCNGAEKAHFVGVSRGQRHHPGCDQIPFLRELLDAMIVCVSDVEKTIGTDREIKGTGEPIRGISTISPNLE